MFRDSAGGERTPGRVVGLPLPLALAETGVDVLREEEGVCRLGF